MSLTLKRIQTEDEHDAALAEILALWGAEPGTAAGDRLDELVALVESYERQQPTFANDD